MKIKLTVSPAERTTIVAALVAYGLPETARRIAAQTTDPTHDGPEVAILRDRKAHQ
jgi:hypothetical protein